MNFQILNENVVIKITVEEPKSEVVTKGGIVIQQDKKDPKNLKVPLYGVVVQVGDKVPKEFAERIFGKKVALPSGQFYRVPDIENPDMTEDEYSQLKEKFIYTNYRDLYLIFNN